MALQNLLGDLNLEATQQAILTELAAKLEAGQTVVASDGGGSLTVDGPLTDTQLRALAVAISGTVALDAPTLAALEDINVTVTNGSLAVTGPLTDTQLRAAAVEVFGNVTVSGTVAVSNFPANQTDALTDAELRADPVPVQDDYPDGEILADQTGADAVLTFTFSADVHTVWVMAVDPNDLLAADEEVRVDPFGDTPSASLGMPVFLGAWSPISVATGEVKIYTPSGIRVTVWGFRR